MNSGTKPLLLDSRIVWLGLLLLLLSTPLGRAAVPEPIARWTFDGDARDSVGTLHGELLGDATITDGRLVLKGHGHVRTAPLTRDLAAQAAEVRGRLLPWDGGRWDEALAIPFVVQFGVGVADASVEMSLPGQAGKPSVRDYHVRLESASGLVLGPFNECRLWVLGEAFMPQPGGLKIVSPASPNPPEAFWLLAQPSSAGTPRVESNKSLQEQGWLSHGFNFQGWIPSGSLMVFPTYTDSSSARFFRMTY
jgi:hypothetical protein